MIAAFAWGCGKEEPKRGEAMGFFGVAALPSAADTKAGLGYEQVTTDALRTAGESFGIYGYMSSSENGPGTNVFDTNAAKEVTFNGTAWTYSPLQYWSRNQYYRFRAFWPYEAVQLEAVSNADNITIEYRIDEHKYDLMFAYATRYPANEGYEKVPMEFQHALSGIRINVGFNSETVAAGKTDRITEFHINGIAASGHVNFDGEKPEREDWVTLFDNSYSHYNWTGSEMFGVDGGSPGVVNIFGTDDNTNLLFAIPQAIQSGRTAVHFKTQSGNMVDHTVTLPPINWEPGKIYNYTFLINESNITVNVTIKPWTVKSSTVIIEI